MLEKIEYTQEDGAHASHHVCVYALSTCGHCKRCLKWMKDNDVKFEYVYYDLLDSDVKAAVKDELKEKYGERLAFPFVVIDEKDVVVGFVESQLKDHLGL